MRPQQALLLISCLALGGLACESGRQLLWETGVPSSSAPFEVVSVTPRQIFLDVSLRGGNLKRRVLSRASDDCKAVFVEGETVTLSTGDRFGPAERDGRTCPLAGIGDLENWRTSRAVGGYGSPVQDSTTRIDIVAEDASYYYARGGFSIAGLFNWQPGTNYVVALLPRGPACEPAAKNGFASVQYREAGRPALAVVAPQGLCPIAAVVGVLDSDFGGLAPSDQVDPYDGPR